MKHRDGMAGDLATYAPRPGCWPPVSFNDDETATASDILRPLRGARVVSGGALQDRRAATRFRSSAKLHIPADAHYEAWQLSSPTGRMWVSLKGGGLAPFPPEPT
jgi:hypothetical protein